MSSTIEVDFEAEERKLLSRLKIFKDVKANKAAIEESKELISREYADLQDLDSQEVCALNG